MPMSIVERKLVKTLLLLEKSLYFLFNYRNKDILMLKREKE